MDTRSDEIPQTKKILMNSFWELYETKKIEKITIKEITERAGYNRSTFYQYFIDIYDVLDQIEVDLLPDISKEFMFATEDMTPNQIMSNFTRIFQRNGKYLSVLLGDHGDPQFAVKMKSIILPIMYQLVPVRSEDENFRYIFEYIFSGLLGILTYWVNNGQELSIEKLTALLMKVWSNGIVDILRT